MGGVPQLKSSEFLSRFNKIDQSRYGEFQLRSLARDAMDDFDQTGNLVSGFIAANCWFDLGKKTEGLSFFEEYFPQIPLSQDNLTICNIRLMYARMLYFTADYKKSESLLNTLWSYLPKSQLGNSIATMSMYCGMSQHEKALSLRNSILKTRPEWEDALVTPTLLEFFVKKNDHEGAIEYFFDLAYANGVDVEFESIDSFLDVLRDLSVHPKLHPELTEREESYFNTIRAWVIEYLHDEDKRDEEAAAKALLVRSNSDGEFISLEQVVKELGLENAI